MNSPKTKKAFSKYEKYGTMPIFDATKKYKTKHGHLETNFFQAQFLSEKIKIV